MWMGHCGGRRDGGWWNIGRVIISEALGNTRAKGFVTVILRFNEYDME
jgi:hypothetical protein